MTRLALCLLLPLCLVSFGDLTCSAELPLSEISTLKVIAEKLKIGPDLWNFSLEPCSGWEKRAGSELKCQCDNTTDVCHVSSITLKSINLAGEFPEELSDLTQLNFIDLTRNYINGSILPSLAKLPLIYLGLIGNRISGEIPKEIGSISTLTALNWQSNQLTGRIPDSLGNLGNLTTIGLSGNDLIGELPPSLSKLTNLSDLRIDGTGLSGKLPSFIGNWAPLKRLLMRGTSLEGPFPSTLSALTKMEELRVTDFKGDGGFPPIENMNSSLKYLSLRNCSISGPIPEYLGNFINLRELDLSFNKFTGRIPETFKTLSDPIKEMYLTNNRLNGTIPDWIFGKDKIDFSYNYFTGPDKGSCQLNEVNLVSSFQSSQSDKTTHCLKENLPCSTSATNYELFINCGGPSLDVNGIKYESDNNPSGISTSYISTNNKWGYSSTGHFVGGGNRVKFVVNNNTALKTTNPLYMSARAAASSLKYYGLCLQSGDYTVELHFAEIIYTDDRTYNSLGRRLFDVSIQMEFENASFVELPPETDVEVCSSDSENENICGGSSLPPSDEEIYSIPVGDGYSTWEDHFTRDGNGNGCLSVGSTFNSKEDLLYAVKDFHIRSRRVFNIRQSDRKIYSVECVLKERGCPWRLRAHLQNITGKFIVSLNGGQHTCYGAVSSEDHPHLDCSFMARHCIQFISGKNMFSVSQLKEILDNEFKCKISRRKIWDAKRKAIEIVYGRWDESYDEVIRLLHAIKEANPSTEIDFEWDKEISRHGRVTFRKAFWAFGPCIEAFTFCRPVIGIDGTFLYGQYKHKLLIATSMDGANHIVPLAFALVDEEREETWAWFLDRVRYLVIRDREGPITLISDRHAGIKAAITHPMSGLHPPHVHWRYCMRHVVSNFTEVFKNNELKKAISVASLQACPIKLHSMLESIQAKKLEALAWFERHGITNDMWTLAYDGGLRWGYMTTNIVESYNAVLKGARSLPVAALLKKTFYNYVTYWRDRRIEAITRIERNEIFTTWAMRKYEKWLGKSTEHHSQLWDLNPHIIYEVTTRLHPTGYGNRGGRRLHVNISVQECSCGKWQIWRIPCSHALAAIRQRNLDVISFMLQYYTWENHHRTYSMKFVPYADERTWTWQPSSYTKMVPDESRRRGKGRPRSTRLRNEMDIRQSQSSQAESSSRIKGRQKCSVCGVLGHNKRRCPSSQS